MGLHSLKLQIDQLLRVVDRKVARLRNRKLAAVSLFVAF